MVGIYYYFKVIIAANFQEGTQLEGIEVSWTYKLALVVSTIITLLLGVFPQLLYQLLD